MTMAAWIRTLAGRGGGQGSGKNWHLGPNDHS